MRARTRIGVCGPHYSPSHPSTEQRKSDRIVELEAQVAELMKENASLKTHEALTDATIKPAADDWCKGGESREAAKRRFGPIEEWDVSQVTNMEQLFYNQAEFNEDLSGWDVSKVNTM